MVRGRQERTRVPRRLPRLVPLQPAVVVRRRQRRRTGSPAGGDVVPGRPGQGPLRRPGPPRVGPGHVATLSVGDGGRAHLARSTSSRDRSSGGWRWPTTCSAPRSTPSRTSTRTPTGSTTRSSGVSTWFEVDPDRRACLSLWTGTYELPHHLGDQAPRRLRLRVHGHQQPRLGGTRTDERRVPRRLAVRRLVAVPVVQAVRGCRCHLIRRHVDPARSSARSNAAGGRGVGRAGDQRRQPLDGRDRA